jgi:hypothetical protein
MTKFRPKPSALFERRNGEIHFSTPALPQTTPCFALAFWLSLAFLVVTRLWLSLAFLVVIPEGDLLLRLAVAVALPVACFFSVPPQNRQIVPGQVALQDWTL